MPKETYQEEWKAYKRGLMIKYIYPSLIILFIIICYGGGAYWVNNKVQKENLRKERITRDSIIKVSTRFKLR